MTNPELPPPVPLYRITLDQLMATDRHPPETERAITHWCSEDGWVVRDARSHAAKVAERLEPVTCAIDGYTMACDIKTGFLAAYDPDGTVVGAIAQKRIFVIPSARGQGLGAELLIRAFETGIMRPATMNHSNPLTTSGEANRLAAHRIAVERAFKAGIDVDPEVLAEYDHLIDGWSASADIARRPGL